MENQPEVQTVQPQIEMNDELSHNDLYGSAGYFVRTDLRAGASCNSHRDMNGKCADCS